MSLQASLESFATSPRLLRDWHRGSRTLIVISGLPASGKSTVGRLLGQHFALPLIDKDTILEALFDALGCPDPDERTRLSRASDEVLFSLAEASVNPILVNWWNHAAAPPRLLAITSAVIEVFCDCPVELAAARFQARDRHRGHQDLRRHAADSKEQIRRMRDTYRGPLNLGGPLVRVDMRSEFDGDALLTQVRTSLDSLRSHDTHL